MSIIDRSFVLSLLLIFSNRIDGACPRATFTFFNRTVNAQYNFIDSSVGNIGSIETCPYTGRPYVYLPCYPNSTWGNEPYFSSCIQINQPLATSTVSSRMFNLTIDQLDRFSIQDSDDATELLSFLNRDQVQFQSASEIETAVQIVHKLSELVLPNEKIPDFYSFANKLMTFMGMEKNQTNISNVVEFFSSLEEFSQRFSSNQFEHEFLTNKISLNVVNLPNSRPKPIVGFAFDTSINRSFPIGPEESRNFSTLIRLDPSVSIEQNRLALSVYDHETGLFDDGEHEILSRVVSLTIDRPNLKKNISSFVKMSFFLEKDFIENRTNFICAFWKIYPNRTARWSTDGCALIDIRDQYVDCQCEHLTHFSLLMKLKPKELPKIVEQILTWITFGGLFLSSIGLILTIATFTFFKKLRRHFSQKSLLLLSINLLLVKIIFALLSYNSWPKLICIFLASSLHYFILSSFSWMFVMALIQYILFVRVFPISMSGFTKRAAAFAQIVPMIPVGIVLGMNPSNYERRPHGLCWLSDQWLLFSFILPIVVYILINGIIFSIVARSLLCTKTPQQLRSSHAIESQRLTRFFVTLSCFVVLGLTWSFGFFIIGSVNFILDILFCVFASLTGFLIFILYILTSKTKRTCWNNALKSYGIKSIYSPTLSTSSGLTGHKDFSTSTTTDHLKSVSQPQHFIDAYMPSSPPAPAPPLPLPPPFLIEHNDRMQTDENFYEPRHVWSPQTNCIYESNPLSTVLDYSVFYASNHDATKL